MLRKLFQWLPVLAASTAAFAAPETSQGAEEVAAGPRFAARQNMQGGSCPPAPCAKPCEPCEPCKPCVPCTPPNRNITPSTRCCGDNMGFILAADFLYWRADENDLPYAVVNTSDTVTVGALSATSAGYVANVSYNWKPGFRIGIGWDTPNDGWDVFLNWTWYRNSSRSSVSATTDDTGALGIDDLWLSFPAVGITSANAKWRLLYNMIDLEIGRDFAVSCGLALRPYFGVRGGWINRKFRVNYGAVDAGIDDGEAPGSFNSKTNAWGVGPRVGLNTTWSFPCSGFMLLGNLSTALIYGKVYKNNAQVIQTVDGVPSDFTGTYRNRKHVWRTMPNMQLFFGLGWGDCFNCNKMYFSVKAGWEANFIWNLQHIPYSLANLEVLGGPHNLSMNGLTVDFKFDF